MLRGNIWRFIPAAGFRITLNGKQIVSLDSQYDDQPEIVHFADGTSGVFEYGTAVTVTIEELFPPQVGGNAEYRRRRVSRHILRKYVVLKEQLKALIEDTTVDVPRMIASQKGWVTPQQWREWELGRRQRAGELVVKMGHIDMMRAARVVEHVTMDESTGAWYAHLRGVKYPVEIILIHSLFVEFPENNR